MKAKTIAKYLLLLVFAVLLGCVYSLIIHTGLDFTSVASGQSELLPFLRWAISVQTVVTFVALFFYMVFFIKFLIKLFK